VQFPWATYQLQSKSTLSDKIFTEKEEYRLGYSENPDFLRLKNEGYRADSNFGTIYFAAGDSFAGTSAPRKLIHVSVIDTRMCYATEKMEEGPPESLYRQRFQTTISCFGQKPRWWCAKKAHLRISY